MLTRSTTPPKLSAAPIGYWIITGLAPILQASHADLTGDLKAGAREGIYQRSRLRVVLLVMQGALSVVLLVGAGLFVRSLNHVRDVRLGYDVDPVLLVDLNMRGVELDSARAAELRRRLLERAQSTPNVRSATLQIGVPFWSTHSMNLFVAGAIESCGSICHTIDEAVANAKRMEGG